MAVASVLTILLLTAHMRPPLVNTWGIVVLPVIHVIIANRTILEGTVTTVVVTVIGTIMAETETGATVEAPLHLAVVGTPPTIGVAEATLAARHEEAALHLETVVVVQENMTHQPRQQALLLLQHLPGKNALTQLIYSGRLQSLSCLSLD